MSATTAEQEFIATGRRKTSTARVRLTRGTGKITINDREFEDYCYSEQMVRTVTVPLDIVELKGELDLRIRVQGGGPSGQSQAIAHGIARALEKMNPDFRIPLKRVGLMKRDPRMKERKKPGQPGARKRFQFSKR